MSKVSGFEWVTNKRTASRARRIVEECAKVRGFVQAESRLLSVTDSQCQFAEWCAEVNDLSDNGDDGNQCGVEDIPARFRSQVKAIVASQMSISKAAPFIFEDGFSLALGHPEAVVGRLRECDDAKNAAQERALLVERERGELTKSFPFSKDRDKKFVDA